MKQFFRIDEKGKIVEIFPFDVFKWIPNKTFLNNCYEVETNIEIKQGMFFIDNEILEDYIFEKELTEIEEIQQHITELELNDIEQGQMLTELELMILGGIE